MYRVNIEANKINPLKKASFSELGFTERQHLQEWIADYPESLGEELLIIQKEFDGFNETRERLDLLALDKSGNLVIIENKLDDSGRDVVWQALKYAGYCSNLSKSQVIEIYQQYLDGMNVDGNSSNLIADFLEVDDLEEVKINEGNKQRLIFVAANYRKEVTNTVLWLLGYGVSCQCFKTTPYQSDDGVFLNIEQIIPTPESQDYMINMASKENEEKLIERKSKQRNDIRYRFWSMALDEFKKNGVKLYENINPTSDHWLSAGSGCRSIPYSLHFLKKAARVNLIIGDASQEKNKLIFNELSQFKEEIEAGFGGSLLWRELPNGKQSRITYEKEFDGYNEEEWPEIISWMTQSINRFEAAIKVRLKDAYIKFS